jgi:hypothetical protein
MTTNENKIDPVFEKLSKETADLIKTGNFDEILRVFKRTLGEDNPALIGAMKMIANGMKAKGDKQGAHKVYTNIHGIMCKQGNPSNPEVLKAYMDVIATTSSVRDAYDMARKGLELANTLSGEDDLKQEYMSIKSEIFKSLTPVLKRLYIKLENRKQSIGKTVIPVVQKNTDNIDDIMEKFGF